MWSFKSISVILAALLYIWTTSAVKSFTYSRNGPCNGTVLSRPGELLSNSPLFQKCFQNVATNEGKEDSLPIIEWKTRLSVLNENYGFASKNMSFEHFVDIMISKYPETISQNIKKGVKITCPKILEEGDKSWETLRKYTQCFYETEEKICLGENPVEKKKTTEGKCDPLPGVEELDGCCKNTQSPDGYFNLMMTFILNGTRNLKNIDKTEFDKCQEGAHLEQCSLACYLQPVTFDKVNNLELSNLSKALDKFVLEVFPEKIQKELQLNFSKYKKILQPENRHFKGSPYLVTNEKYVQDFAKITKVDEKLNQYCAYAVHYRQLWYTAVFEYCTSAEHVKTVLKDFIVEDTS